MFNEKFVGLLQLDLAKLKQEADEIAGRWNGEDEVSNGVHEEEAHLANDISDAIDTLQELLEAANA